MLVASQALTRLLDANKGKKSNTPGGMPNSTNSLLRLIEGWCVDVALRTKDEAIAQIPPAERTDEAVLAALTARISDTDGRGAGTNGWTMVSAHWKIVDTAKDK